MRVLVIGAGGREHALVWGIANSPLCQKLYCAPGNPGIQNLAECIQLEPNDILGVTSFCQKNLIDFVVIGPEGPLTLGLSDALKQVGIPSFGPSQKAAALEGSKGFMKDLCARAGIPTAEYRRFTDPKEASAYIQSKGAPIVVKADGLAAGKGVTVARSVSEAIQAVESLMTEKIFGDAGTSLVVEEFMEGEEVSFFALCDGEVAIPFTTAQDHKTVFDGDKGPNTGGMGAYSPAPMIDQAMTDRIMREIINPTMVAMSEAGCPFSGMLYAGLMITKIGPRLIEYNVRFGDPETQVMIPRLKSDLLALLHAAAKGCLEGLVIEWQERASLCVVLAAEGYPGSYKKGTVIHGLAKAEALPDVEVFHAGTTKNDKGEILASGGRVLGVTAVAPTVMAAQKLAYQAVDQIKWPEGFCRHDIGWRAVAREKAA